MKSKKLAAYGKSLLAVLLASLFLFAYAGCSKHSDNESADSVSDSSQFTESKATSTSDGSETS